MPRTPARLPEPLPGLGRGDVDVVINWGLGRDSSSIIARLLDDPAAHGIDLERTAVIHMATGDEWPDTIADAERFMLPLFRRHGLRLVQLARAGQAKAAGIEVLDDSRCPAELVTRGSWTLWEEMESNGTVPQQAGTRLCSLHAKAEVGDRWIPATTGGGPFRQIIGFNADEPGRAKADAVMSKNPLRTAVFPLIEWGWGLEDCQNYLFDRFGIWWKKSYCTFCFMWNRAGLTCGHGPHPVGQVPHCCRASTGSPVASVHGEHRASSQHHRRVRAGGRGPPAVLRCGRHGPVTGPRGHRRSLDQGHA
ncbi:hypothetical protein [Streptomyces melanosporofaciens]|uniref:Phosphoadenosine phosphosulfate reductase family protein n=1 Tax=Streptomyces melanosporofaciens TaxID=67327 RepID=A0A1H4ICY6_STRMJ|nr:hypothetical protein [Streptomyces melanosporofaciens]SEB31793.1 hypothetical protein SAMN04490356_0512 [Streptomyces melanosporofaciens]